MNNKWKWRDNELSLPEFYKLNKQERDDYILLIVSLKPEERSSMDEILLNGFNFKKKENNNFFTINPE